MEILDMECAKYGSIIADSSENDETLIRKSLGVLQEDGVYAFFIYLCSTSEIAIKVSLETFKFLKEQGIVTVDLITKFNAYMSETNPNQRKEKLKEYINSLTNAIRNELADDIDKLLFTKELLERTLVYARYHAKASGGD